jgi:amino acid transporter
MHPEGQDHLSEGLVTRTTPAEAVPATIGPVAIGTVTTRQPNEGDPELAKGAISLLQNVVTSVASSAPGQSSAVTIAALIAASSYAGGFAILVTTLPMLAIAFAYHRLNLWQQSCGASYVWVGRSISPYLGFMVGWIMLAGYGLGTVSDILPIGPSVLSLFGLNASSQWGEAITVAVLGGAITVLAVIGITVAARFQVAMAAIEYAVLLVFAGIAFYVVFIEHRAGTVHPSWQWLSPSGVGGHGSLIAGMLIAVYLFTGWDTALYLNEETEKPERNPGLSAMISVAVLAAFYFVLVVCLQGVASEAQISNNSASALTYIASRLVSSPWDKFMALAIVLSVLGTTQAFLMSAARISYAMGADRVLPSVFGKISRKHHTPAFATVLFGGLTIGVTWLYVFSSSVSGAFNTVVSTVGVIFAVFYAVTGIATAWFYRRLAGRGVRKALIIAVLPLAGAGVLLYIAARSVQQFPASTRWVLVVIVGIGLVLLAFARLVQRASFFFMGRHTFDPDAPPAAADETPAGDA